MKLRMLRKPFFVPFAFNLCLIYRDLIYKPIVLACGHISCFWFICPDVFPSTEKEKNQGFFSPQLGDNVLSAHSCEKSNCLDSPEAFSSMCSQAASYGSTCSNGKINTSSTVEKQTPDMLAHANASLLSAEAHSGLEVISALAVEESSILENDLKDGICELVSISDVLCVACKQLLFRPAVLNCGHVCCQSCIVIPVNEALRCQLCQSSHPKGLPKVCLELDHLLEKIFPKEYALRREAVQLQPIHGQQGNPSAGVYHLYYMLLSSDTYFMFRITYMCCAHVFIV
ncbi:hypothetical protein IFM89_014119 [Coptis chinensis]|uniref:RING-type domain-containing protein n=1 Tax=Coptis chinensis TaxID=261450 RepID=A0A835HXI8_9MAGN|nr:hypothetical protein IFM89_014119 [Coptis chinensis]